MALEHGDQYPLQPFDPCECAFFFDVPLIIVWWMILVLLLVNMWMIHDVPFFVISSSTACTASAAKSSSSFFFSYLCKQLCSWDLTPQDENSLSQYWQWTCLLEFEGCVNTLYLCRPPIDAGLFALLLGAIWWIKMIVQADYSTERVGKLLRGFRVLSESARQWWSRWYDKRQLPDSVWIICADLHKCFNTVMALGSDIASFPGP